MSRRDGGPSSTIHAATALRRWAEQESLPVDSRAAHLARIRARAAELACRPDAATVLVLPRPRRRAFARQIASGAVAGALVAVLGAGVAVAASEQALPGQMLYRAKTLSERVALASRSDDGARTGLLLALVDRRLTEAEALLSRDWDNGRLISATLAEQDRLIDQAFALAEDDVALQPEVEAAAREVVARLEAMLSGLPPQAAERARLALDELVARLEEADAPREGAAEPSDGETGDLPRAPAGPRTGDGEGVPDDGQQPDLPVPVDPDDAEEVPPEASGDPAPDEPAPPAPPSERDVGAPPPGGAGP